MLASLHVQNFKCLRDVKVAFGPFTVLIGLNDSGKSSILDALRMLGRTVVEPLSAIFHGDDDLRKLAWKGEGNRSSGFTSPITWIVELGLRSWRYTLKIEGAEVHEHLASLDEDHPVKAGVSSRDRTELSELIYPDPDDRLKLGGKVPAAFFERGPGRAGTAR
ncbi:MAG: AAA family ATPase [Nannocystis sp.]|nr:AAA family ATPase [Nannocystis sp.]MBA3550461.1 AAA family ATPase [Nannocystis sp.]